eukprot:XP_001706608.1 Hypothetical protein GL50803_21175 [Giardia lamblia ATCC 50803]
MECPTWIMDMTETTTMITPAGSKTYLSYIKSITRTMRK